MKKIENNQVRVLALGGAGEVGKNMFVVEVDDEAIVIDAGLKFPGSEMFGIDMVIPDMSYIDEIQDKIKGIFVTHGHEDHIGALGYLLGKVNVPIYSTKLTNALVKDFLSYTGLNPKEFQFKVINPDSKIRFAGTTVSFFRTLQNIPGSIGIVVRTSFGSVVYTSDFKLDPSLNQMEKTDIHRISTLGQQGVLCLLSDSTNAEQPGFTPSEFIVREALVDAIYNAKGRVIVTTFATNIYRVVQVVEATLQNHRKMVIVGHSMKRTIDISQRLGYIHTNKSDFVSVHEMDKHVPESLVILTTGAQGDPIQALTKMAKGTNKFVNVEKGDTIIISATAPAGDELDMSRAINHFTKIGAEVIYNTPNIHVSGHASQEELKLMIQMTNPKYFVPVHGEYRHQKMHGKLACQVGMDKEHILIVENGEMLTFTKEGIQPVMRVPAGQVMVDGLGVGDVGSIVLQDRKLLSNDGILVIAITLNRKTKKLCKLPEITSRGFVYVRESEALIEEACKLSQKIVEQTTKKENMEWSLLKNNVRDALSSFLYEKTKRRPMILPIVLEV